MEDRQEALISEDLHRRRRECLLTQVHRQGTRRGHREGCLTLVRPIRMGLPHTASMSPRRMQRPGHGTWEPMRLRVVQLGLAAHWAMTPTGQAWTCPLPAVEVPQRLDLARAVASKFDMSFARLLILIHPLVTDMLTAFFLQSE